jgi:hypothetical protein
MSIHLEFASTDQQSDAFERRKDSVRVIAEILPLVLERIDFHLVTEVRDACAHQETGRIHHRG